MPHQAKELSTGRDRLPAGDGAFTEHARAVRKTLEDQRDAVRDAIDELGADQVRLVALYIRRLNGQSQASVSRLLGQEQAELERRYYAQAWQIADYPGPETGEIELPLPLRDALRESTDPADEAWQELFRMLEEQHGMGEGVYRVQFFQRLHGSIQRGGQTVHMSSEPRHHTHSIYLIPRPCDLPEDGKKRSRAEHLKGGACVEPLLQSVPGIDPESIQEEDVVLFLP